MAITAKIIGFRGSSVSTDQQNILLSDARLAYAMVRGLHLDMEIIFKQRRPNKRGKRQELWLDNPRLTRYFGTGVLTNPQFNSVHRKIKQIENILFSGNLKMVVKQNQSQCSSDGTNASSGAGWNIHKKIFICPSYFRRSTDHRPAILIHEIVHKLGPLNAGIEGHKNSPESQVLSQVLALVQNNPRKARRNPDTFELLCMEYFHRVDAAFHWKNNKIYLFCGNRYVRFTPGQGPNADTGFPKSIDKWNLPKPFHHGIDAAVYLPSNEKLYLFKDSEFVRISAQDQNGPDPGYPKAISEWSGLPTRFQQGIDAAVWRGTNNKVYFFKGKDYVRFSDVEGEMDNGYPKAIGSQWGWFPSDYEGNLGASLWDRKKERLYFFRGNQYIRSSQAGALDPGYPNNILENWRGVPTSTATFNRTNSKISKNGSEFKFDAH